MTAAICAFLVFIVFPLLLMASVWVENKGMAHPSEYVAAVAFGTCILLRFVAAGAALIGLGVAIASLVFYVASLLSVQL